MKRLFTLVALIATMLVLAGCGGTSKLGGNIIKDEGSLVKIMGDFKNLSALKGKEIMVFQDIGIYTGQSGNRVTISIIKPGTKEDVDAYEYKSGSWSGPKPVRISGKGAMEDNITPLSGFDFSKPPMMYKEMEDKLKGVEGAKINDDFTYRFWKGKWTCMLSAKATRGEYNAEFTTDGQLISFNKR